MLNICAVIIALINAVVALAKGVVELWNIIKLQVKEKRRRVKRRQ